MASDHLQVHNDSDGVEPVSLSHLAHVFRRYAGVILVSLVAIMMAYAIFAAAVLLLSARQRTITLPFRLEFNGADRGEYPNGLKFSVQDITATPVLLDVFKANELGRFTSPDQFSRSLYVLESNLELERLSAEYQAKLADSRLTPVDRERIEREFESKRAAISKSDYALQFTAPAAEKIPAVLIPKILDDTLKIWARRAAIEKKVLDYRVPALTPNILDDVRVEGDQYLVPILLLRRRVDDVIKNIGKMFDIPGTELVRTKKEHKSLEEIHLTLDELIRFRLEPLIETARGDGLLGSSSDALRVLRAQLAYDERALEAARGREAALRSALATYESTQRSQTVIPTTSGTNPNAGRPGETVMPQISDTFLERIVDLANSNADREFRQKLTEEIKEASLFAVPLEAAVKYDHQLIDSFTTSPPRVNPPGFEINGPWKSLLDDVHEAIRQVNEIYVAASRQLYPETELYRVLGPPVTRTQSATSRSRLALGGVLTFLIAIPLIIVLVLVHNRVREEEQSAASLEQRHTAT